MLLQNEMCLKIYKRSICIRVALFIASENGRSPRDMEIISSTPTRIGASTAFRFHALVWQRFLGVVWLHYHTRKKTVRLPRGPSVCAGTRRQIYRDLRQCDKTHRQRTNRPPIGATHTHAHPHLRCMRAVRGVISSFADLDRKLLFACSGHAISAAPSTLCFFSCRRHRKMVHDRTNLGLHWMEASHIARERRRAFARPCRRQF